MAKTLVALQLSITEPCWALTWSPTHHMAEFSPRFRTTTSGVSFPNPHCCFPWFWDIHYSFFLGGKSFHTTWRHFSLSFTWIFMSIFANAAASHGSIEIEVQGSTVDADHPIRVASWLEAFYICLFAWFLSIYHIYRVYTNCIQHIQLLFIKKPKPVLISPYLPPPPSTGNWLISETNKSITSAPQGAPLQEEGFQTRLHPENEHGT